MLDDRNDKYEPSDESEYHYSEEDVSYEVEPGTPKGEEPPPERTESFLQRLTRSRRMILSLIVFLVLVFVVYRMVAPVTPPAPAESIQPTAQPPAVPPSVTPARPTTPVAAAQPVPPANVPPPPLATQVPAPTQPTPPPLTTQPPPSLTTTPEARPATPQPQTVTSVISTSTTPAPSSAVSAYNLTPPTATTPISAQVPGGIDAGMANLAAQNERLISQLQADYTQRINEFTEQNKNLQDEVRNLSSRVATMETELTKLLQALTRQVTAERAPTREANGASSPRVPYSVQAIIPGRAWLRADNGDAVTVAEGDMIKGLGRVVKIDPYDGVVEVSMGNKVISLSYGNGG